MEMDVLSKLKEAKLDYSAYGKMPIPEEVLSIEEDKDNRRTYKQWEKLNYLRKHLRILDQYIRTNMGESINDWLAANRCGLSDHVIKKIGAHNNATGGISAYFFNLQHYYDEQEHLYDNMEATAKMPPDVHRELAPMRDGRRDKRKNRREMRRIQMKGMKADGKGYLVIEVEEPVNVLHNANGEGDGGTERTVEENKPLDSPVEHKDKPAAAVRNMKSTIGIVIAGAIITITVLAIAASAATTEKA